MDLLILALISVLCIASIYLIAKGVEKAVKGTRASNPNRSVDLLFGIMLILPGLVAAGLAFYWLLPTFMR